MVVAVNITPEVAAVVPTEVEVGVTITSKVAAEEVAGRLTSDDFPTQPAFLRDIRRAEDQTTLQKFLKNGNRQERTRGKTLVGMVFGSFRYDIGAKEFLSFRTWKWLSISAISCTGAGRDGGNFPCWLIHITFSPSTPLHISSAHISSFAKAFPYSVRVPPPTSPLLLAPLRPV